jgi:hypothetical protein
MLDRALFLPQIMPLAKDRARGKETTFQEIHLNYSLKSDNADL